MKFGKPFWIKIGIESLLIVFSVLLALALNEYRESRKEAAKTHQVLLSLQEELQSNKQIVEAWQQNHQVVLKNIQQYRMQARPYDSLVLDNRFQYEKIAQGTFISNVVRSTAWETAKSAGVVQNFDIGLANALSSIYDQQKLGIENTSGRLIDLVFDRDTHRQENAPQTLVLMEFTISELVGQEAYLLKAYDKILQQLDEHLAQ